MNAGKNKRIDPDALGLWECCDGIWYTPGGRCPKCGKTAADRAGSSASGNSKPEPVETGALVQLCKAPQGIFPDSVRLRVTIVRGCGSIPLDHDNLVGGSKPLRDAIAKLLGRDDAERHGIEWEYRQEKGAATRIEIQEVK
ncbi:hypothetical protein [Victivallis vadensis]|uniref:hypothetical protein n=1 Tax=Victivallis vadensis TaxID=172901 RepID=UPI0023F9ABB0|nr:hypothetical protein [Victivallis vadensis]